MHISVAPKLTREMVSGRPRKASTSSYKALKRPLERSDTGFPDVVPAQWICCTAAP